MNTTVLKKINKTTMINMLKDDGWGVKESGKKMLKRHAVKAITCNVLLCFPYL